MGDKKDTKSDAMALDLPGSAQLTVTGSDTVGYIDGKKTAPRADGDAYSMWEEENRLVQYWLQVCECA
ncbi:unnamed protein product [Prunus armeniaca]|uniref:Uncharacterized protein n=1 Tax=Prunus armeniaca TaxID=36596 RepID=A0A6J5X6A7_PRUAR|nr:unnamed protein product [Prunus armeniaca]